MEHSALLLTLTGSLAAALVLGYITERLRFSPIVGYLLAGVIVGPYTPGFVANQAIANELAEIGVILLMFGVGLHFHLKDLLAVKTVAITGALTQSAVATALGALAAHALGWPWGSSVVFGVALSVASTVMLTRVLADNRDLHTLKGRIAIGWLVVEDILTVVVLVLLPALLTTSATGFTRIAWTIGLTVAKLAVAAILAFVVGGRLIPRILNSVAGTQSRELFTLTVLALALGIAVGSAVGFGISMALGAFLAGMIVGQSEFSYRAATDALPMRDAFAVLFFVSVGMLLNPAALLDSPVLLAATLGVVLIGKPIAAFLLVALMGYGSSAAIGVAMALAQIGEFSMILASVGTQLGILPEEAGNLIVAVAIVSLTVNPILYRAGSEIDKLLRRFPALWRLTNLRSRTADAGNELTEQSVEQVHHAVVIGYGPIGRTLSRLLQDGGITPVIIDANLESTRRARTEGHRAVYGEAAAETLEAAGVREATALIVCGPEVGAAVEIVRIARRINPEIRILARTNYLRETPALSGAGANAVYSGEGEVALAMTEHVLRALGATPEQMDRERQRVREEVFPKA